MLLSLFLPALSNPFTGLLYQVVVFLQGYAAKLPLPASISSYAVAIIGIAILIKVVTYPLTLAQQRSMKSMQAVQPKLKALQEVHKGDRQKLAEAQMELYREHGVNPFGGCLPLVIQLVVLFGLYRAIMRLNSEGLLAGERFLWIPDLSLCEPSWFCGAERSLLAIAVPLMLVILVISQMAYQRFLTPPSMGGGDNSFADAMATTNKIMPLMFAFFFYSLPAGLLLYYAAFNLVSIGQHLLIDRHLKPAAAGVAVDANGPPDTPEALPSPKKEDSNGNSEQQRSRRKRKRR